MITDLKTNYVRNQNQLVLLGDCSKYFLACLPERGGYMGNDPIWRLFFQLGVKKPSPGLFVLQFDFCFEVRSTQIAIEPHPPYRQTCSVGTPSQNNGSNVALLWVVNRAKDVRIKKLENG